MSDLEAIRERAERERRERHEAEQERKRAEREERLWAAELKPEPEPAWWTFTATSQMNAREFSAWCDAGKPKLGPVKAAPAPSPPRPPVLDKPALARSIASGIAEAIAAERKVDLERIGKLEGENADLQRRMRVLEEGLIQKALTSTSEPLDLPRLPRLNGRDAH